MKVNEMCEKNFFCNCDGSCFKRMKQEYGEGRDIPETCTLFDDCTGSMRVAAFVALVMLGAALGALFCVALCLAPDTDKPTISKQL